MPFFDAHPRVSWCLHDIMGPVNWAQKGEDRGLLDKNVAPGPEICHVLLCACRRTIVYRKQNFVTCMLQQNVHSGANVRVAYAFSL